MADFGKYVVDAFNAITPDLNSIFDKASGQSLDDWMVKQRAMVAGSGAAAVLEAAGSS
jgi:hypothetical protein